jgi:hypothetical protein
MYEAGYVHIHQSPHFCTFILDSTLTAEQAEHTKMEKRESVLLQVIKIDLRRCVPLARTQARAQI